MQTFNRFDRNATGPKDFLVFLLPRDRDCAVRSLLAPHQLGCIRWSIAAIDEEAVTLSRASQRGEIMSQSVEKQSEPSSGGGVLLVDEDLEQLEFERGIIQGIGCSVQACNSYTEGIRQLVSGAFDVIVVGQGSRNFEGRCVLEGASEFNRRLPVIVVARHLEMGCYLEAMQLGAVDYLAGPFDGMELARVMRNWALRRKIIIEAETAELRSPPATDSLLPIINRRN